MDFDRKLLADFPRQAVVDLGVARYLGLRTVGRIGIDGMARALAL